MTALCNVEAYETPSHGSGGAKASCVLLAKKVPDREQAVIKVLCVSSAQFCRLRPGVVQILNVSHKCEN